MLIDEHAYAAMVGISVRTAQKHRGVGEGCPFVRIGGRVLYDPRDIEAFIDRQRRTSTSDTGPEVTP